MSILELTTQIVISMISNGLITANDLPQTIEDVYNKLNGLSSTKVSTPNIIDDIT